jgi:hypothetical protein
VKASAYTIVLEGLFTLLEIGPDDQTEPKATPPQGRFLTPMGVETSSTDISGQEEDLDQD